MSPRSWKERIQDILDAMGEITSFISGMDFKAFQDDPKTIRAVELNFVIIGEAANAIPDIVQDKYPEVPWSLMRGLRNRLIHAYFSIEPIILWETVRKDFPPLIDQLHIVLSGKDD